MSASGEKRPAVGSEEDGADRRPSQQPRLEASASAEVSTFAAAGTVGSPTSISGNDAIGIDIDLICSIASFMNTGDDLANLCVSVGPTDAAKIRTEYLRDNEKYVTTSLNYLDLYWRWDIFRDNLHLFDKCRDNILAWMSVNTNWKKRCTGENMERYKGFPLRVEANLVFNNPAVAMEVGLLEVFRFLVEEKGVDVNRTLWTGFNSNDDGLPSYVLIRIALVRGDIEILEYLLSVDGFDITRMSEEVENDDNDDDNDDDDLEYQLIDFSCRTSKEECFNAFIRHPKVNVNAVSNDGNTPLYARLDRLCRATRASRRRYGRFGRHGRQGRYAHDLSSGEISDLVGRITLLLKAGANPHALDQLGNHSLLEHALHELEGDTENQHWRAVVQQMEEAIEN